MSSTPQMQCQPSSHICNPAGMGPVDCRARTRCIGNDATQAAEQDNSAQNAKDLGMEHKSKIVAASKKIKCELNNLEEQRGHGTQGALLRKVCGVLPSYYSSCQLRQQPRCPRHTAETDVRTGAARRAVQMIPITGSEVMSVDCVRQRCSRDLMHWHFAGGVHVTVEGRCAVLCCGGYFTSLHLQHPGPSRSCSQSPKHCSI